MSKILILAGAVLVAVAVFACWDEKEERQYKLAYEVTKSIDCIPWQFNEDSEDLCLCFGEARAFGVFAFLGPDHLCFEVDEEGKVVYEDTTETPTET
jgi:hypothetical protein